MSGKDLRHKSQKAHEKGKVVKENRVGVIFGRQQWAEVNAYLEIRHKGGNGREEQCKFWDLQFGSGGKSANGIYKRRSRGHAWINDEIVGEGRLRYGQTTSDGRSPHTLSAGFANY